MTSVTLTVRPFAGLTVGLAILVSGCSTVPPTISDASTSIQSSSIDQGAAAVAGSSASTAPAPSAQPTAQQLDFQNKQSCAQYVSVAQQQLSQKDQSLTVGNIMYVSSLDRVFYSKSRNSCLYTSTTEYIFDGQHMSDEFSLYDVLSGQLLTDEGATYGADDYQATKASFNYYLKQYE